MIEPGNRNNTLFELARTLLKEGKPYFEIRSTLHRENRTKNRPPLHEEEVNRILLSVTTDTDER